MRTERARIKSDTADPVGEEACILSNREIPLGMTLCGKKELSLLSLRHAEVFIDSLLCLFCNLKPYRSTRFLLPDRHSFNGVSVRGDVFDFERNDIATA
jgi:hypothetical protein